MKGLERATIPIAVLLFLLGTVSIVRAGGPGTATQEFYNTFPDPGGAATAACKDRRPAAAPDPALHDFGDGGVFTCNAGAALPAGYFPTGMRDPAFTAVAFAGFVMASKNPADPPRLLSLSNLAPCAGINECNCDKADLLTARLFNSYKRKAAAGPAGGNADNTACPVPFDATGGTYTVTQDISGVGVGDTDCKTSFAAADCVDVLDTQNATLKIGVVGFPSTCGATITKTVGAGLSISPSPPCSLASSYMISNGGNSIGLDLLPEYLLQIQRNNFDGVVTVDVRQTPASSFRTFTTDTTGKSDAQVLEALCTGFAGLGLDLRPIITTPAAVHSPLEQLQPGTYDPGKQVIYIRDAGAKVNLIRVTGFQGQTIVTEASAGNTQIPTLSDWGMVLLVLLFLVSGYWLFRRQRRLSRA